MGFEPTRGDPIGLAGRRLNRSAKVSLALAGRSALQEGAAHEKNVRVAAQAESDNGSPPSHSVAVVVNSLECCLPFNMHGTNSLAAMMSATHAEGRQFCSYRSQRRRTLFFFAALAPSLTPAAYTL